MPHSLNILRYIPIRVPSLRFFTAMTSSKSASVDIWQPSAYLTNHFHDLRTRPGLELLARIQKTLGPSSSSSIQRIVDIGCGTGQLTREIGRSFPRAKLVGSDSSGNMLERAREQTSKMDDQTVAQRIQYQQQSMDQWSASESGFDGEQVDLVFSNAALHWTPVESQEAVMRQWWSQLERKENSPSMLAVQIPNNFRAPSHTLILETLRDGQFCSDESEVHRIWSLLPRVHEDGCTFYFHVLRKLGARMIDTWESCYNQLLPVQSADLHPVCEWTSSTALAPILNALKDDEERKRFKQLYSQKLYEAYPAFDALKGQSGQQVLFPFKRIFFIAMP